MVDVGEASGMEQDWASRWRMADQVDWELAERARRCEMGEAGLFKFVAAATFAGLALGFGLGKALEAWSGASEQVAHLRLTMLCCAGLVAGGALGVAAIALIGKARVAALASVGHKWATLARQEGAELADLARSIDRAESLAGARPGESTERAAWNARLRSQATPGWLDRAALALAWRVVGSKEQGVGLCSKRLSAKQGEELAFEAMPKLAAKAQALLIEQAAATPPASGSKRPRL